MTVGETSVGNNNYPTSVANSLRDSEGERRRESQRKTCRTWHETLGYDRPYPRYSAGRQNCRSYNSLGSGLDVGRDEGIEELYSRFKPLLKKTAQRFYIFHRSKITSYEDLYQTICYLFLYAIRSYNPEKGRLAPHIKRTVNLKLRSMLRGEKAPLSGKYPFSFLSRSVCSLDASDVYSCD